MDELIKTVSEKAGITPEQAQRAVDAVIEFAKAKLPAPFAAQVESLLQGGDLNQGLGGLTKGLGGLFGGR